MRQAGPDITVSYLPNIASKEEADLHFTITMDSTEARVIYTDVEPRPNEFRRRPLQTVIELVWRRPLETVIESSRKFGPQPDRQHDRIW